MNQLKRPLFEALIHHSRKNPISFHVPGHKYGQIFPEEEKSISYFQQLLKIDATELSGLDDLHAPDGPIYEAEELLAGLYNVKKSFFLVNGSTSGNLAMIMSACEEEQLVLVQRNCHKSVLNALKLAKANPIFLEPEYDDEWNAATGIQFETVREALSLYPEAKVLILTYPNYYGIAYDVKRIIDLAHQCGIPVLVDEAHGPHFIIGDPFPPSSLRLGADMAVHSAHKTLPAMTMGSYLHFNSELVNINKVIDYLHIFQSSSPSYPIMASLDLTRSYLATYQDKDVRYLLEEVHKFKAGLGKIPGIRVLQYPADGDPLKITIQSTCGLSGFALQKRLEEAGIYTELADPFNILFVLPLLKENQVYPFRLALEKIVPVLKDVTFKPLRKPVRFDNSKKISSLAVPYKVMDKLRVTDILLEKAEGEIAAETIIPYPPGIPLLLRGEKITSEKIESLKRLQEDGAKFQGGSVLKQNRIQVFGG